MARNFTLQAWEIAKGFVLTCQSRPLSDKVVVSYDDR
jgi:ring-1,2-phenylacetyl-CoA epoxidase subunit PaaE